jgi:hypothetical protein
LIDPFEILLGLTQRRLRLLPLGLGPAQRHFVGGGVDPEQHIAFPHLGALDIFAHQQQAADPRPHLDVAKADDATGVFERERCLGRLGHDHADLRGRRRHRSTRRLGRSGPADEQKCAESQGCDPGKGNGKVFKHLEPQCKFWTGLSSPVRGRMRQRQGEDE